MCDCLYELCVCVCVHLNNYLQKCTVFLLHEVGEMGSGWQDVVWVELGYHLLKPGTIDHGERPHIIDQHLQY